MKYALVTGGSRGIGRAICLKLAGMGIPVIINFQSNTEAARELREEILAAGGRSVVDAVRCRRPEGGQFGAGGLGK